MRRFGIAVLAACALTLVGTGTSSAVVSPQPYGTNDAGGFNAILPPGNNGFASLPDLISSIAGGPLPANSDNALAPYTDLIFDYPSLNKSNLNNYFHDGSFGVKPENIKRTYSPRSDVTIIRDEFGSPHVYGSTRSGTMFGAGYIGAEDRLFFMDALRHAGRGELASFAGGANAGMDIDVWNNSPYTEADLQAQYDYSPPGYEQEWNAVRADVASYVDGINKYITESKTNPALVPGEYIALNHPLGPDPWKATDVIATAGLVGGIFGKGGGREVDNALVLERAKAKFNGKTATRIFRDFRSANDPEAPVTAHGKKFKYQNGPKQNRGRVLPDPGTTEKHNVVAATSPGLQDLLPNLPIDLPELPLLGDLDGRSSGALDGLGAKMSGLDGMRTGASNALVVSAKESRGGRPTFVAGPQVSYFAPQILMESDLHGPGIDARGASFVGINMYVLLGRGTNYSFSATSAGQDIIDTFAVPLCEPDGSVPTKASMHYLFRGSCKPIEVLEKTNSWAPSLGDQSPPGSMTLRAERTALGLVNARALVKGKPVVFTKLRSTYMHEAESAIGFRDFNNPQKMQSPKAFQKSASKIGFTFNWLYANDKDTAYYNSGDNPRRSKRVAPDFPVAAKYEWQGFQPATNESKLTAPKNHPQTVNQRYNTSWNNRQAKGYRASDDTWSYGSAYRSITLDQRIKPQIKGKKKISLVGLVKAMEGAATVDLRGVTALPYALKIIGSKSGNPAVDAATADLRTWLRNGAHRRDADRNGTYEHSNAIRIMDAWWEPWMRGEFEPRLGTNLFDGVASMNTIDDSPSLNLGSAYNGGFYSYANKDLRTLLAKSKKRKKARKSALKKIKGKYSRVYCGKGSRKACRAMLISTLATATTVDPYPAAEATCTFGDKQACFDAIKYRALGGLKVPDQPWQNRPSYQQAVQVGGVK
ncbi:MAG: penicillin acylase family protein [Solirubrobacterales bacterium]